MILFKKAVDISKYLIQQKNEGRSVGFVPTMGALHPGHLSLIKNSQSDNSITVCSIFVNPAQFNDKKDFDNYPSTIEQDIDMLEEADCDVLFYPDVSEIYPVGTDTEKIYDLGYLENVLEGKYRPGHFQGVCMVVHKLLTIIPCNTIYIGQKDYQQCMVIKKLIEIENIPTSIIICPTLREADGLAMSSRNVRLSLIEREKATLISETLLFLKNNLKPGNLNELIRTATENLNTASFKVDYIEIANANNLELIKHWDGKTKTVALAAAFLGDIRLIDNMLL